MGRPKGSLNRISMKAREIANKILTSEDYRNSIARRIRNGALPPGVEVMLWHYAYGKPKESVELRVTTADELQDLTEAQLAARASELSKMILEAAEATVTDSETRDMESEDQIIH